MTDSEAGSDTYHPYTNQLAIYSIVLVKTTEATGRDAKPFVDPVFFIRLLKRVKEIQYQQNAKKHQGRIVCWYRRYERSVA